jgi:hypothetical protein
MGEAGLEGGCGAEHLVGQRRRGREEAGARREDWHGNLVCWRGGADRGRDAHRV